MMIASSFFLAASSSGIDCTEAEATSLEGGFWTNPKRLRGKTCDPPPEDEQHDTSCDDVKEDNPVLWNLVCREPPVPVCWTNYNTGHMQVNPDCNNAGRCIRVTGSNHGHCDCARPSSEKLDEAHWASDPAWTKGEYFGNTCRDYAQFVSSAVSFIVHVEDNEDVGDDFFGLSEFKCPTGGLLNGSGVEGAGSGAIEEPSLGPLITRMILSPEEYPGLADNGYEAGYDGKIVAATVPLTREDLWGPEHCRICRGDASSVDTGNHQAILEFMENGGCVSTESGHNRVWGDDDGGNFMISYGTDFNTFYDRDCALSDGAGGDVMPTFFEAMNCAANTGNGARANVWWDKASKGDDRGVSFGETLKSLINAPPAEGGLGLSSAVSIDYVSIFDVDRRASPDPLMWLPTLEPTEDPTESLDAPTDEPTAAPVPDPTPEPRGGFLPAGECDAEWQACSDGGPNGCDTDEGKQGYPGVYQVDPATWPAEDDGPGKNMLTHYYLYSDLEESCHHACMRYGEQVGTTMYCDDNAMFNVDHQDAGEIMDMGTCGICVTGNQGKSRNISRNKSAWAPYMRNDGKCFYAHFKGKHKCYVTRDTNHRLCGCVTYEDLVGETYEPNTEIAEMNSDGEGWHIVADTNCNRFCDEAQQCSDNDKKYRYNDVDCTGDMLGLQCDADALKTIKGAYDMRQLEQLTLGEFGDDFRGCAMYDDRLNKMKNPSYRYSDDHCYVTPVTQTTSVACNIMSRDPDFRWCKCADLS